jgi:peptidoglycan/LPS O-acetylase OafA/YrhL
MNPRLQYLDVSRFFAIIGVIGVHVGHASINNSIISPLTEFGRFGVQLFFVISGATVFLTYEYYRNTKENYLVIFYIKRFFRITPLFILMALYYSWKINESFIVSILPWSGLNPYNYNNIEGGWSIWNEMYFYLIFPIYYFLRQKNLTVWIALIYVYSLVCMSPNDSLCQ